MLLELKEHSFGTESTNCKQARGYLAVAGSLLQGALAQAPAPPRSSVLVYCVSHPDQDLMLDTLQLLKDELHMRGIDPLNEIAAWAFQLRADGMYILVRDTTSRRLAFVSGDHRIIESRPGEDATPLLIIPYDPSGSQPSPDALRYLEMRIRVAFSALMGSGLGPRPLEFTAVDVLRRAILVWDAWHEPAKTVLVQATKRYVRKVLAVIRRRTGVSMNENRGVFQAPVLERTLVAKVRSFLRSGSFLKGDLSPGLEQLRFDFDQVPPADSGPE